MVKVYYGETPEFPGYLIGTDGSVWSCWEFGCKPKKKYGAIRRLKPSSDPSGYSQTTLKGRDGVRKWVRVHSLVLITFIGDRPEEMEACHRNGNRSDNRLGNLRWGTHKSNNLDKKRHGTSLVGERNPRSKLTEKQVIEMREIREKEHLSFAKLGKRFGVAGDTAHRICVRKTWGHIN